MQLIASEDNVKVEAVFSDQNTTFSEAAYNELMYVVIHVGRVARKPINASPGLKVQMFSASYFLFSLRLFKFKSERQTI